MDDALLIRGVGLITPLGQDAAETFKALLDGKSITSHSPALFAGAAEPDRVSALAAGAAGQAVASARWSKAMLADERTALVVGTSKGAVEAWIKPATPTSDNEPAAGGHDPIGLHTVAMHVAHALGLTGLGPRLTLSSACATGLHALIRAALLLKQGDADRALVVAAESSIGPLFLASYQRLGVLASPGEPTRPFDLHRSGFLASEAAAAVCLERGPEANGIAIKNMAMAADAHHLTGSDSSGASLRRMLKKLIGAEPPDLIHAHGTATRLNDQIELAALESVLDGADAKPLVYSHKGALGHSLGAAGLVGVVLNVLIHRAGIIPPNPNTRNAMPAIRVTLAAQSAATRNIRRSLIIAAGFGGAMAGIALSSR